MHSRLLHHSPIDSNVEDFGTDEEDNVIACDTNKDFVSSVIIRTVGVTVYLASSRQQCVWLLFGYGIGQLTFEAIMFDACTCILYSALATVLVLTVPALRLVIATIIGCKYGSENTRIDNAQVVHGLRVAGSVSKAIRHGNTHI